MARCCCCCCCRGLTRCTENRLQNLIIGSLYSVAHYLALCDGVCGDKITAIKPQSLWFLWINHHHPTIATTPSPPPPPNCPLCVCVCLCPGAIVVRFGGQSLWLLLFLFLFLFHCGVFQGCTRTWWSRWFHFGFRYFFLSLSGPHRLPRISVK